MCNHINQNVSRIHFKKGELYVLNPRIDQWADADRVLFFSSDLPLQHWLLGVFPVHCALTVITSEKHGNGFTREHYH
eukprot:CFRG3513T1